MAPHLSRVDTAGTELDGAESETIDPSARSGRWWLLLVVALGPLITGYAAVAALLALVTAAAANADFSTSGVLLAAGPGWLAAHQVPLDIAGGRLGMGGDYGFPYTRSPPFAANRFPSPAMGRNSTATSRLPA